MPEENQESNTIHLVCNRYGTEAEFESIQDAYDAGWVEEEGVENPNWYSPEAMENGTFCADCHRYVDYDHDDYISNVSGDDETYHTDCAERQGAFFCENCENWFWEGTNTRTYVDVYNRDGNFIEEQIWCEDCVDQEATWNDDNQVYEYRPERRETQDDHYHPNPEGIKPELCTSCIAEGHYDRGQCEKCLKNQAYNINLRETTTWVFDDFWQPSGYYHPEIHKKFKETFLRTPDESPYLYYGIEAEIGFDPAKMKKTLSQIAREFIHIVKGRAVAESDSSVINGIEFIFRPMSYKYITLPETIADLKAGFEYLIKEGAFLKQPNSNGVHIHMSRKFFERNTKKNPSEINRDLDWVFQYFQPEIEEIAGRKYTQYCWSKIDRAKRTFDQNGILYELQRYTGKIELNGELEKSSVIENTNHENHHAVICQTNKTFEVRAFNSTVNVDTILAYIEFVRNIAHTVRNKDLKKMNIKEILASKDSPYLDKYIWKLEKNGKKFDREGAEKIKYTLTNN